jgi:hypothetical protein
MIIVREHVVKRKRCEAIGDRCEWIKRASRIGESRKLRGLVTQMEVAKLPEVKKPALARKKRTKAHARLPGVRGDSAYGKEDRGTREALLLDLPERESITLRRNRRESERPIVAKKQSNVCGAKGPY